MTSSRDQADMARVDALIAEAKRTGLDYSTTGDIVGLCGTLLERDSRHKDFVRRTAHTANLQAVATMDDYSLISNNPWAHLAQLLESF
jgi:hypothetical protein